MDEDLTYKPFDSGAVKKFISKYPDELDNDTNRRKKMDKIKHRTIEEEKEDGE